MFSMVSVFTAGSIGNLWPSYALNSFYSPSPVFKDFISGCSCSYVCAIYSLDDITWSFRFQAELYYRNSFFFRKMCK